jgi:metal-responsive CopG/Arc/MetJ family transcriptional regulator
MVAGGDQRYKNRSQLIRLAVQEYVARLESLTEEEREREIFRGHLARLAREAVELVKDQAKL